MKRQLKVFTVRTQYEPDKERQVAAILLVLSRATRGRSVETVDVPAKSCRPRQGAGGGSLNQRRANDTAVIEECIIVPRPATDSDELRFPCSCCDYTGPHTSLDSHHSIRA